MERILACVDFSAVTARILRQAGHLAARVGAEVIVLHVAPPEPDWVGHGPGPQSVRDAVAHELRDAHGKTQRLADHLRADGWAPVKALTVRGSPAETILAQADALDVSFLVLGAHHHGVIHELFVGSVARKVLRRTARPVLVVPEKRA